MNIGDVLFILLVLVIGLAIIYEKDHRWRVVRVYDGDTLTAEVYPGVYTQVRAYGYDAPEIRGRCEEEIDLARRARDRLTELTIDEPLFEVVVEGIADPPHWTERTYARIVVEPEGDVGQVLISEGLAVPYYGGERRSWCPKTQK